MTFIGNAEDEEVAAVAFASPDAEPSVKNSWDYFNSRQRWSLVFVLFLIASSGSIDRAIISVLLEPIKTEFHVSDTALGVLTGVAFGILYAILGLPIARYADRGNRRLLISISVGLWSIFTAACGAAGSFFQLFLFRIGVGVGEAGGTGAPAMSLLADYFPPEGRARAVGFIQTSTLVGAILGLVGGGYIAQYYGWRMTLYAAGIPGILIALVAWIFLREPRMKTGFVAPGAGGESLLEAFRILIKKPTFINVTLANLFFNFVANGAFSFTTAYLVRVLHQPLGESGGASGFVGTVSALVGNVAGGLLAAHLSKRDMAWLCRIPGYGILLTCPIYVATLLVPNMFAYIALSSVGGAILLGSVPPMITTLLVVVGTRRRATGFTIAMLVANLIGVTSGPVATGMLSDFFSHSMGSEQGLRWGLIASLLALIPSGLFMLRAGRTIHADIEV